MKKIISVFVLTAMMLSSMSVSADEQSIRHSAVVGTTTITISGLADDAVGLPLNLKIKAGDTYVHLDQGIIDKENGFIFTFPILPEETTYTYTLRHPRMEEVSNGTFHIFSANDEEMLLSEFRNLNVGVDVENRVSKMTNFLTTPLNAQILNLDLAAYRALRNPEAVSEKMCDAFNQLTSLELISAKFAELILTQEAIEAEQARREQIVQDIQNAASLGDMLDKIETNAEQLGLKTEYGFENIKEAFDNGDILEAAALKDALEGAITPEELNRALVNFAALVAFEQATWGQFDAIEQYYENELGSVFDIARTTLTDLELIELKQSMQDVPTFSDMDAVREFVQTKTTELVNSRPSVRPSGGGGGGGGGAPTIKKDSLAPVVPQNNLTQATFTDCEHVSWAKDSILRLKAKGIVNGKSETSFNPDDSVTREEFLKMLLLACKIEIQADSKVNFEDVSSDSWCVPYVSTAVNLGIVKGISDTEFGVGQEITRQDMAVLCYRVLKHLNKTQTYELLSNFVDSENFSDYAVEAIGTMHKLGIIKGMDGNRFEPFVFATRAQAAVIVDRLMSLQ